MALPGHMSSSILLMVTGMLAAAAVNAIEALMIKIPLDSNIMA